MMMKVPDVIKAIGRGMNPNKAISLLNDDMLFELIELKSFVGKKQINSVELGLELLAQKERLENGLNP